MLREVEYKREGPVSLSVTSHGCEEEKCKNEIYAFSEEAKFMLQKCELFMADMHKIGAHKSYVNRMQTVYSTSHVESAGPRWQTYIKHSFSDRACDDGPHSFCLSSLSSVSPSSSWQRASAKSENGLTARGWPW